MLALRKSRMTTATDELLARLAGKGSQPGLDPYVAIAASKPKHEDESGEADKKLNQNGVRIGFGMRCQCADDVSGESVECRRRDWLGPTRAQPRHRPPGSCRVEVIGDHGAQPPVV